MAKSINNRKLAHIQIVKDEDIEPLPSSFEKYKLPYKSLPYINYDEIDTSTDFIDWKLSLPFFISSMTGGPELGEKINRHIAEAAQEIGVGFGLGSMRVTLRKPETVASFDVKRYAPDVPMFANFGAIQLNYGYGVDDINKIMDSVNADGIFLHINSLQEVIQPEGDTNWKGVLDRLSEVIPNIERPVIIKEVGHGIDKETAKSLKQIGVKWIDVSGLGGTSWAGVEAYRRDDDIGHLFADVGIPTDQALMDCSEINDLNLIAGGGIRNGKHIATALMLGAKIATAAKPLLEPALTSTEKCIEILEQMKEEFKIAMFSVGAGDVERLKGLTFKE